MSVNGLVSYNIYFKADARPDRAPVKFVVKVFTVGVLRRTGDYASKSVLNSLQFKDVFFVYNI